MPRIKRQDNRKVTAPPAQSGGKPAGLRDRLGALKRVIALLAGVGAIGGGLVGYLSVYRAVKEVAAPPVNPSSSGVETKFHPRSIAVLPFANPPGNAPIHEQLSTGMADELMTLLVKNSELHVVGRYSAFAFKERPDDLVAIGKSLKVLYVLTGSIQERDSLLGIRANLINVATGQTVWSEKYDIPANDLLRVEREIAASIPSVLKVNSVDAREKIGAGQTASLAAHIQLLIGRQQFDTAKLDGYRASIAAYKEAISLDPLYSAAYAGLSMAEFMLAEWTGDADGIKRSAKAADKAVELAPEEAVGYSARAFVRLRFGWDWKGALSDLERSLKIAPGDSVALREYGLALLAVGRLQEAVLVMQRATDLNPVSSDDWAYLSRACSAVGQSLEARLAAERAFKLRPESTRARIALGTSRLIDKRSLEARELFAGVDDPGWRLTGLAMAEYALGDTARSSQSLRAAIAESAQDSAFQIAQAFAWQGDATKALEWLQRAYQQRDGGMITLGYDPLLVSIRERPQYKELMKQLGLQSAS